MISIGIGLFFAASKNPEGSVTKYNGIHRSKICILIQKLSVRNIKRRGKKGDQNVASGISKSNLNFMTDVLIAHKNYDLVY